MIAMTLQRYSELVCKMEWVGTLEVDIWVLVKLLNENL